jgi:hypothetical protein
MAARDAGSATDARRNSASVRGCDIGTSGSSSRTVARSRSASAAAEPVVRAIRWNVAYGF